MRIRPGVVHRKGCPRGRRVGCDGSDRYIAGVSFGGCPGRFVGIAGLYFMRRAARAVCEKRWYHEAYRALVLSDEGLFLYAHFKRAGKGERENDGF